MLFTVYTYSSTLIGDAIREPSGDILVVAGFVSNGMIGGEKGVGGYRTGLGSSQRFGVWYL
jgi:hypothetical protein